MPLYPVLLLVSNKEAARDPEGETLTRELRSRGFLSIARVRAGKFYVLYVEAEGPAGAVEEARRVASEARLYNPVVHEAKVMLLADGSGGEVSGD